jgi:hypothetical protein
MYYDQGNQTWRSISGEQVIVEYLPSECWRVKLINPDGTEAAREDDFVDPSEIEDWLEQYRQYHSVTWYHRRSPSAVLG